MTYCVGILLNEGVVFASTREQRGRRQHRLFCKMNIFERVATG